nr:ribonuclease H-like domain-containing protein [Corynebacterium terpenotabidum]
MTNHLPAVTGAAPVTPADLTGCRRRSVLTRAVAAGRLSPEITASGLAGRYAHHGRRMLRRSAVWDALPTAARLGDRVRYSRVDVIDDGTAEEQTLEAIAAGVRLITGARLADGGLACDIDLLVRCDTDAGLTPATSYMPVAVTAHTIARRTAPGAAPGSAGVGVVDVAALGLSAPVPASLRHRSSPADSQRVAVAHVLLDRIGVASGSVGFIGGGTGPAGGYTRCVVIDADRVLPGLERALSVSVPEVPVRVKECVTCEFHNHCRGELLARADISLMLPGDRGTAWRDLGVDTLPALADLADRPVELRGMVGVDPEDASLAAAWLAGVEFLRRPLRRWITRPDLWCGHPFRMPDRLADGELPMASELADAVEIDVDMEAHPVRGTFLWGTFDGSEYRPFTDFSRDGDEGEHVARYWAWLMARRRAAHDAYRVFRVYCYSQQGENHWMRSYAGRFGGREYAPGVVMPTLAEVNAFLNSGEWVDVFALVKAALAATGSLGLKSVARLAGFSFSEKDVDGRAAVDLFEVALGEGDAASAARRTLERYNADDCYAPAAVRRWLRLGAPGVPPLEY